MPASLPLLETARRRVATADVTGSLLPAGGDVPAGAVAEDPAGAGTEDPAGAGELLGRLRSPLSLRPSVDPGLAGGLRAWLEDGVAGTGAGDCGITVQPGPGGTLTLVAHDGGRAGPKRHRTTGVAAGLGVAWRPGAEEPAGSRGLRTALLRTVFRITVTAGPPRAAFEDTLAALAVDEGGDTVARAVQRLSRHRRTLFAEAVRHAAATITAQWSPPPASWLPRTGERMVAPLSGGRVVLRSDPDLVMGAPSSGRASVCALRVHGGTVTDDGPNRRLLALLETLRSGAAPFRVASYDLDRGRLTVDDVTDEHLSEAVRDVLSLVGRHASGKAGNW